MVSKVVLSPSTDGDADLHINDVVSGLPARTPVGTELHLGSQDLVRLAAYASTHGFVVTSFMISDAYLVPLVTDEQTEISDGLVEALRAHGGDEVEAAMQNEYDGLYVVGVNLVGSSSGMRISVRRRGYVDTSVTQEAEQLLKSAWRELRLS